MLRGARGVRHGARARFLRHGLFVTFALLVSCGRGSTQPVAATATVSGAVTIAIAQGASELGASAFGMNPLTIAPGTRVTWINRDSLPHTTTADDQLWDSGLLNPGESFSFTFTGGGTFAYHCNIHGAAMMSGTIVVTGTQATIPAPPPLTPTFKTVRDRILNPHCMACHVPPSPSGNLDFTNWDSLVHNPVLPNLIVAGNANQSRLYLHIVAAAGGGGQEAMTAEEQQAVFDWIQSGAPND